MNTERLITPEKTRKPDKTIRYDAVVFDVDSTLVTIEGLDWLAYQKGYENDIVQLTKKSMDGTIDFHEAMATKMRILAPTHEDFIQMGKAYCQHIVPGAVEVIAELKKQGVEVWLMSGNYRPAVTILADRLGIDPDKILCNTVQFDAHGKYLGFDATNALAKNGGKAEKIRDVLCGQTKRIVFVGDSATDLDVQGSVALFVGFGGVVEREVVKKRAERYIADKNLYPLLAIISTDRPEHKHPNLCYRQVRPHRKVSGIWKTMGGLSM